MPWEPSRYNLYKAERGLPFDDLVDLVDVREGLRVIDLGCGTGRWTAELAKRLPESSVLGIDASAEMLAAFGGQPQNNLRFEQALIQDVEGQWDLVFSQSSLQWILDHETLIPKMMSLVAPGGQLVVQLPSLGGNKVFSLIASVAKEEPFVSALGGWVREFPVLSLDHYAQVLWAIGITDITVLEKVFPHVLDDRDAVIDWFSGSSLIPYLERLDNGLSSHFVERFRERLRDTIPKGPLFFPLRRIMFAARQPNRPTEEATNTSFTSSGSVD